ncbi:MAG TPA: glycosyltransferase, partial [Nitrospirae bacterium]|nr:glycosyltransferase [Nitrospirota bacterium]
YLLQEEVLKDLPNILIGENPDIPDCEVSKGWDDLKKAYRENRLFINTTMPPWEDGYNLGLLEATATGMPVVSVSNPTCPITDGVDGYVCDDAATMRKRVIELIDNRDLAAQIGGRGREMARQKFPMDTFLEKWNSAINKAVEVFSTGFAPSAVFQPSADRRKRSFNKKMRTGRKNVILSYTSYPATAASYIEKALRKKHDVITAGCKITPEIIEAWNLGNLEEAKTHDIHTPDLTVETDFILERIPARFTPDFFLWVETGLGKAPNGLEKMNCPTAAYFIDTHMHLERDLEAAARFDLVFLAQRAYIPEFKERGIENIHWLPLACDQEIHDKMDVEKTHDVGFVGSLTDDRRVELLQKLAEKMEVRYAREFLKKMTGFLCKSRVVFNNAIRNDLNMRVFEALCSGSLLLTDLADGIDEFFEDEKHLVIYNDENITKKALYYLKHPDEAQTIARRGRDLALEKHTYERRVDEIVKTMERLTGSDD